MFSQTVEYALRAVVALARHPDAPLQTRVIAEETQVPIDYLFKVLQLLSKAGFTSGSRGVHGGYALTRAPAELTVLEIVNAIDPLQRIEKCPLNLPEHKDRLCSLHRHLDQALAGVESALGAVTIAQILEDSTGSGPLG